MKKVLFVYKNPSSFVMRDLELLQKSFVVTELQLNKQKLIKQFLSWLKLVKNSDIVFCWFGSFLFFPILIAAKILRKKIVIVAGGFDVAKDKKFGHGSFSKNPLEQFFRRTLFKLADKVITISKSNHKEAVENAKISEGKLEMIYHGFNLPELQITPWNERAKQVVMIANVSRDKVKVKGVDQFFKIAEAMPEVKFILVGKIAKDCEYLFNILPQNIEATGELAFNGEEFNRIIMNSKIVIQLSHYESFGAAVVDAALRGCFPIVYRQFALPEVVEGKGKLVDFGDIASLKSEIESTLNSSQDTKENQAFFHAKFSLENRENALNRVLKSL